MSATLMHNNQTASNPWDLPASFAGLNDSDFLAMLEKQVNTDSLTQQSYTLTPPLSEEDSSPSPPHSELERTQTGTPEEMNHKRKLSPDDEDDLDDEAPAHKSHRDSMDGTENKKNRRKSTGGQKDETRVMKRKEQNRAAQRAFRERKEKHVRDLEDRVAVLEAEKAETANENENLKDLLNRLQTENQLLKQGQFTFSMPGSNKRSASDGSTDSSPDASSSTGQEPVFSQSSPPIDMSHNNPVFSTAGASEPSLTSASDSNLSMFGSFPVTPTWTTLATAPQYTSYRDPIYDRIFGGAGDISPYATRGDEEGEGGLVNLEELFGEDFGDLMPIVGDFSPAAEAVLAPIDTTMKDDHAAAASLPLVHDGHSAHDEHGDGCPRTRQDIINMMATSEPKTFGPPVAVPPAEPPKDQSPCTHAADLGLVEPLGKADPNLRNVPISEAWKQVRSNPHFEDCDIDELCLLLKEQARCGGGQPVIEEPNFNNILQHMGNQRNA
ncbi:hypothetical protein DACRYDRAFT_24120 [Dacryopinax primogenitus]|uniref:BZIP domain-containing protein n=1 Tax=Dacryopinax primogenitus (strain DJM 731) TaxID=1858805 RepID=M5FQA0_DACPD|nr:uncharacterized protein DACRYDRAFT_24120 [Dacryopinax primogenitus]EJT99040.1 hypothetical protein DACRYDRAFT_24120 [Dacryopinax primogenitus]